MRCRIRCASSSLPSRLEELDLLLELVADLVHRAVDRLLVGHVLRGREDREVLELRVDLARERVEVRDLLDLVAEERDAVRRLHRAPAAPRSRRRARGSGRGRGTSRCASTGCPRACGGARRGRSPARREQHGLLLVLLRRADAVDARDGRDDQDVAARRGARSWPRGAAGRCRRSPTRPSRCRDRPAGRTPRAGSSRSTRRSTRPRAPGRNSRNSLQSCAASVLLCAITSVGRWTCSTIQAIVAVFPVPVAPRSVWKRLPALDRARERADRIAAGRRWASRRLRR